MSYDVSMQSSRVQAGEVDYIFTPRHPRLGNYGVVLMHSAITPSMGVSNSLWPDHMRMCAALANAGITVVCPQNGLDTYANNTAMTRIDSCIALLGTLGFSAAKAHLIGVSQGGGAVARYAGLHPTKVASVNALIPMANPRNLFRGKWGPGTPVASITDTWMAPLAAAWGCTSRAITLTLTSGSPNAVVTSGALTIGDQDSVFDFTVHAVSTLLTYTDATHCVLDRVATGSGSFTSQLFTQLPAIPGGSNSDVIGQAAGASGQVPGRLFYASLDQYIVIADVVALGAATGWDVNQFVGTNHTNNSAAAWRTFGAGSEFSDLVAYLKAHGA